MSEGRDPQAMRVSYFTVTLCGTSLVPVSGARGLRVARARALDHEHSRQADGTPYPGVRDTHSRFTRRVGTASTMAQTGVSGLVVVDGESFFDALFASAGQG